ncbi:MAG: M20/M25/M40 family metallo-hydrolase [Acidobacteria bacterium]|nr:M20/M25/M40 family metallo-hydrolase [Acidobacteriota bacterium]
MAQPGITERTKGYGVSSLQEIIEHPTWQSLLKTVQELGEWLDRVHLELTQIPAPTFQESARAEYMSERFRELGLRTRRDSAGNLLVERQGATAKLVALTAHLDTVVPPGVPIEVRRRNGRLYAPGISDNGAGLAALLGIAAALEKSRIATGHSLLFVANVGEEGEGDLLGMRHLFAQRDIYQRTTGVIVLDGSAVEHITVSAIGSRRFLVEVTGPGGHSWNDFGRVNPIQALATAVTELRQIRLPSEPRTTLNVGMIHGGTAINAIPGSSWMKVDIRSTSKKEIDRLAQLLEQAVRAGVAQEMKRASGALEIRILPLGDRPVAELPASARILRILQEVDRHLGIPSKLERSSTDANIPLSLGIEAITTGGGGRGGDAHTPNEWYEPRGRDLGLKRLLLAVLMLAGIIPQPTV